MSAKRSEIIERAAKEAAAVVETIEAAAKAEVLRQVGPQIRREALEAVKRKRVKEGVTINSPDPEIDVTIDIAKSASAIPPAPAFPAADPMLGGDGLAPAANPLAPPPTNAPPGAVGDAVFSPEQGAAEAPAGEVGGEFDFDFGDEKGAGAEPDDAGAATDGEIDEFEDLFADIDEEGGEEDTEEETEEAEDEEEEPNVEEAFKRLGDRRATLVENYRAKKLLREAKSIADDVGRLKFLILREAQLGGNGKHFAPKYTALLERFTSAVKQQLFTREQFALLKEEMAYMKTTLTAIKGRKSRLNENEEISVSKETLENLVGELQELLGLEGDDAETDFVEEEADDDLETADDTEDAEGEEESWEFETDEDDAEGDFDPADSFEDAEEGEGDEEPSKSRIAAIESRFRKLRAKIVAENKAAQAALAAKGKNKSKAAAHTGLSGQTRTNIKENTMKNKTRRYLREEDMGVVASIPGSKDLGDAIEMDDSDIGTDGPHFTEEYLSRPLPNKPVEVAEVARRALRALREERRKTAALQLENTQLKAFTKFVVESDFNKALSRKFLSTLKEARTISEARFAFEAFRKTLNESRRSEQRTTTRRPLRESATPGSRVSTAGSAPSAPSDAMARIRKLAGV